MREENSCEDTEEKGYCISSETLAGSEDYQEYGHSRAQVPFSSWLGILACPGLLAHFLDDLLESRDFSHFFKPVALQISVRLFARPRL
jgi:hypothetical protein